MDRPRHFDAIFTSSLTSASSILSSLLLDLMATNYERFIGKSGVFNASLSDNDL